MAADAPDKRNPNDILAAIQRAEADQAAEQKARYDALVMDTAAGVADADRVAAELKALNVPTEVFTAAVQRVIRRRKLLDRVEAGREAGVRMAEVSKQIEEAEAELVRMREDYETQTIRPLRLELEQLERVQSGMQEARAELRRGADPELVRRAEDLARQRDQTGDEVRKMEAAIASWQRAAERGDQRAEGYLSRYEKELTALQDRKAKLSRLVKQAEAALLQTIPSASGQADKPTRRDGGPPDAMIVS